MNRCSTPVRTHPLQRFHRCGRGAIAISLAVALPVILAGVMIGVEAARLNQLENRLQIALDAASLAGTRDVDSPTLAQDVRQVFDANFAQDAPGAEVTTFELRPLADEHGIRRLALEARARLKSPLGRLLAAAELDWLETAAASRTLRQTQGVELVMVLDNTGSMRSRGKIADLRQAAQDLADVLFDGEDTVPNLWVGIVPYTATVNVGNRYVDWLAVGSVSLSDYEPTVWKGCVEARADGADRTDTTPAIRSFEPFFYRSSDDTPLPGDEDHFLAGNNIWPQDGDVDERNEAQNAGYGPNLGCGPAILPLTPRYSEVSAKIAEMQPWHRGGTMSNLGLVWGWRALSPKWRGLWYTLDGDRLDRLPLDYDTPYMNKVVVLMTDGNNQWYQEDYTAYRYPNSGMLDGTSITDRMKSVCNAMKIEGIVIFAITFGGGVNSATEADFRDCASAPDQNPYFPGRKYFDAPTALDLRNAFGAIGGQLTELRLTQ